MKSLITVFLLFIFTHITIATNFMLISDLGASAESISLGNIDGFTHSAAAVFNNPATLHFSKGNSVSFFSTNLMNEVNYYSLSMSSDIQFGRIAFGLYDQSVADIPKTAQLAGIDKKITKTGAFDYKNTALKFSYQTLLTPRVSLGVNYAYYTLNFETYAGTGSNIDIGILTMFPKWQLSVFAQNILFNQHVIYNHNALELLPFSISTTAIIPYKDFHFLPQLKHTKEQFLFSKGISYNPSILPFITLRGGYKQQLDYTSTKHQKYTMGLGLYLFGLAIDYAYERSDYFLMDHNNYISFNINL